MTLDSRLAEWLSEKCTIAIAFPLKEPPPREITVHSLKLNRDVHWYTLTSIKRGNNIVTLLVMDTILYNSCMAPGLVESYLATTRNKRVETNYIKLRKWARLISQPDVTARRLISYITLLRRTQRAVTDYLIVHRTVTDTLGRKWRVHVRNNKYVFDLEEPEQ